MYQIRSFFVNSVQRSQTVVREVIRLVIDEFQKRIGHSQVITDSDETVSNRSIEELKQQFAVVRSEEEMVDLMQRNLASGQQPFDVIISPFGCDQKSLPLRIRQQLEAEEKEEDFLPKKMGKRVSNFSSPAATPTAQSSSPHGSSSSMCHNQSQSLMLQVASACGVAN